METIIEKNNKGVEFFLNKNFDNAEKLYKEALNLDENNATTLNNLGLLYHQLERYETAINQYQKAIFINAKDTYYLNLANSLMFLERQNEAIDLYEKCLQMNPDNINAKVSLAKAYEVKGEFKKAEVILEMLVSEFNKEEHKVDLAKNYMIQGDFGKGLVVLMNIDFIEEKPSILSLIGVCEFNLKNYGLAEEAFKKSLSLEPDNGEVRHYLAINYLSKGNILKALKELEFLIKMFPENLQVKLDKCMVFFSLKKYREADRLLDEVLQLDKGNTKAIKYKKVVEGLL